MIKTWANTAKLQVSAFEIASNTNGAIVTVDGIQFGTTPLALPLYLEPGRHNVALEKQGYMRAEKTVNGAEGSSEKLNFNLVPVSPELASPKTTPAFEVTQPITPPRDTVKRAPNPWVLVGGGVITAGAIATGVIFNIKAATARDDARALRNAIDPGECVNPAASLTTTCRELGSGARRIDRNETLSGVGFAVAGAAAVGTLAYWFWPRTSPATRSALRVDGSLGKAAGSVALTASF